MNCIIDMFFKKLMLTFYIRLICRDKDEYLKSYLWNTIILFNEPKSILNNPIDIKSESFVNFYATYFSPISSFFQCYAFQNSSKLLKCWISICRIWIALNLLHLNFMIIKTVLQIIMVAKILWITLGINQKYNVIVILFCNLGKWEYH